MIAALPASVPSVSSSPGGSVIYQLHGSRPLPTFEARKSVKDVVLRPRALKQFHKFLYASRGYISLVYAIGYVCGTSVLFIRKDIGEWLAVANCVFGIPPHIITYLVLRYDLIVLICSTFEFWYVMVVNFVCMGLVMVSYHDWRGLVAVWSIVGNGIPFFMDAVHRGTSAVVVAVVMGAVGEVLFMATTAFDIVDQARHSVLYENDTLRLTADDVILNGLGTIVVLLLRNAYRKYGSLARNRKRADSQQRLGGLCIMYRCCLELHPTPVPPDVNPTAAAAPSPPRPPQLHAPVQPHDAPPANRTIQLICVPSNQRFDGRVVMMPRWLGTVSTEPLSRRTHRCLWLVAFASQVSLVLSNPIFATWMPSSLATLAPWLSITTATVFCGVYFAHCQRQLLLRELCGSFDFVFMLFQFTTAHWCICDMLQWDATKCLSVLSSWLWSHWLITLDAVTPVMKRKLGFHARGAICVDAVLLLQQLTVAAVLFSSTSSGLYTDRLLLIAHLFGHTKEICVVPIFVWRNFTCFLWCVRLLWRLVDRKGDELLVLQGQVQYEDSSRGKPRAGAAPIAATRPPHGVVPFDGIEECTTEHTKAATHRQP